MKLLDIVRINYGLTLKEARSYIKTIDENMKQALINEFNNNAKRNFYND